MLSGLTRIRQNRGRAKVCKSATDKVILTWPSVRRPASPNQIVEASYQARTDLELT